MKRSDKDFESPVYVLKQSLPTTLVLSLDWCPHVSALWAVMAHS